MFHVNNESEILSTLLQTSDEIFVAIDKDLKIVAYTQSYWNYCMKYFSKEVRNGRFLKEVIPWNKTEEECWTRSLQGETFTETRGSQQRRFFTITQNETACQYIKIFSPVELEEQQQTTSSTTPTKEVRCESKLIENGFRKEAPKRVQNFHPMTESGIILWTLEHDGKCLQYSHSWEQFTGYSLEDSVEWGWIGAHHVDDRECLHKMWSQVTPDIHHFRYSTRLWSAKEHQYRYVLIHATKETGCQQWCCVGLEINDSKQSVRNLKRLTKRMQQALAACSVGTWEYDIRNDILTADNQVYCLFGLHSGPPMAHTWGQFLAAINPDDKPACEKMTRECVEEAKPYNVEFRVPWEDGSVHWLVGKGRKFYGKDGNPYILGVNWDITATKESEQQHVRSIQQQEEIRAVRQAAELERQHKVIQEEFMDTICHEIRNPLVGIYGSVNLMRDHLEEMKSAISKLGDSDQKDKFSRIWETARDFLDSIFQCAEQQKVIVDDVLDLSKLEACKIELNPTPFSIKTCINTVLQMFSSKITEKGLVVKTDVPKEDWVKADLHRLQQVIINLVSNAVKFTNHGEIIIGSYVTTTSATETLLTIKVQDTGIGISASELPQLFERFTQAKRTFATYGGSGLGLAISKRLVAAMGGKITVESQQGVGSTFQFTIKCQSVSESERARLQVASRRHSLDKRNLVGQKLILIVDDNTMNQKILANYLEKEGHLCRTANNGLEALEKCQQEYYDLIFMDIEMPVMNGLEATRQIRQTDTSVHIPIVGLSGNARKEKIDAAFQAGMDDYLTKPYKRDDIVAVINKIMLEKPEEPQKKRLKTCIELVTSK